MNSDQNDEKRAKKTYRTPELIRIPLRPQEAVLGACKGSHAAGPGGSHVCSGSTCKNQGS